MNKTDEAVFEEHKNEFENFKVPAAKLVSTPYHELENPTNVDTWAMLKLPTKEIGADINRIIAEAKLTLDEPKPETPDDKQLAKIREQRDLTAMQIEKL